MKDDVRRKALLFLSVAVILTVVIAASLPQLEFQPGTPLPAQAQNSGTTETEPLPWLSISVSTLFKMIVSVILSLAMAYGIYQFLKKIPWKEILRRILLIATLTTIGLVIMFALGSIGITTQSQAPENIPPVLNIKGPAIAPLPISLIWLVWIGLTIVILLLGILLINWRAKPKPAAEILKLEAERAVQALKIGTDLKNVIVRCYLQMSLALQNEKGIKLEETMTAREFERLVEARGIPYPPVHQLTQLFEAARYGFREPDHGDEQKAIDCLSAIVQYSRERKHST